MAAGAIGSGAGVVGQALHRQFDGAREAGRIGASKAFRDRAGNPFGDVGAPQVAKDIGGQASRRRDPALQSLAADGEQRDLLPQNCERRGRGRRLPADGGRLDLRGLDRRLAGQEAGSKPIRRRVGPAGQFAALLDGIKPMNDLVKAGQAVADEARGNWAIALANHRQDVLGGVHRASHRCEVDDAGAAFERVERTERAI